jgi:hypothetical protein
MFHDIAFLLTNPCSESVPTHVLYQWLAHKHDQPYLSSLFTIVCDLMADSYPPPKDSLEALERCNTIYSWNRIYNVFKFSKDYNLNSMVCKSITQLCFALFLSKEDMKRLKITFHMHNCLKRDLVYCLMIYYTHMGRMFGVSGAKRSYFPKVTVRYFLDFEWLKLDTAITYRR